MRQIPTLNTVGWQTTSHGPGGLLSTDSTMTRMRAVNASRAVADWGSDPDSAYGQCLRQQRHTELGSDPKSAAAVAQLTAELVSEPKSAMAAKPCTTPRAVKPVNLIRI